MEPLHRGEQLKLKYNIAAVCVLYHCCRCFMKSPGNYIKCLGIPLCTEAGVGPFSRFDSCTVKSKFSGYQTAWARLW